MRRVHLIILAAAFLILFQGNVFGASIQVNRDETYDGGSSNQTYTAFKIFDATKGNGGSSVSYFLSKNSKFAFIRNDDGVKNYLTFSAASDNSGWVVGWKNGVASSEENAIALANAIWGKINYNGYEYTVNNGNSLGSGTDYFPLEVNTARTSVPEGFYLIQSSLGTNLAMVTTDVTITEKNTYPVFLKEFSDGMAADSKEETDSDSDEVQVKDTISYTLSVEIPYGANQMITITDTMDSGLDPLVYQNGDNGNTETYSSDEDKVGEVIVKAKDSGGDSISSFSSSAMSDRTFHISMTPDQVTALAGETITFEYKAVVKGEAALTPSQENTAKLAYGGRYETADHTVSSLTRSLTINKTDGENPLTGAQFELRRDDKSSNALKLVKVSDNDLNAANITKADNTIYYRVADGEDAESGKIIDMTSSSSAVIFGLDDDSDYIITETKAPAGFNKLDHDETAEGNQNADRVVTVTNLSGSLLPATGGKGTLIFYVTGAVLVIVAGAILWKRRKDQKALQKKEAE